MQTVSTNTPEQINAALFTLNAELTKKIKALETKLETLSALEARIKALETK